MARKLIVAGRIGPKFKAERRDQLFVVCRATEVRDDCEEATVYDAEFAMAHLTLRLPDFDTCLPHLRHPHPAVS